MAINMNVQQQELELEQEREQKVLSRSVQKRTGISRLMHGQ